MIRKHWLLAGMLLAGLPAAALAQDQGLYLGLGGGWNAPLDSELEVGGAAGGDAEYDDGWAAIGTIGYAVGNGIRGELELGYRSNDIDGFSAGTGSGDVKVWSAMANVLYDIFPNSGFSPYVGAGFGLAHGNIDATTPTGATIDDGDSAAAGQAIAGINVGITDNITLFTDYRYFVASEFNTTDSTGASVESEYATHTVLAGLRFSFGAPPPPPPPPPAAAAPAPEPAPQPAIPRAYLVFFEFDRADLTPEGRQIVQTAAANAQRGNVVRIEVTGHADRSGPADYNQRLSMARAETVRNTLVQLGVPAAEIGVAARGEADPLVPTADGVREPQNRRVEIVFGS